MATKQKLLIPSPPPALAPVKRLLDWYEADAAVREECQKAPYLVRDRLALQVDPAVLRPLWDVEDDSWPVDPLVQEYWDWLKHLDSVGERLREACAPHHPGLQRWRARQMERCRFELPAAWNDACKHFPLTIELSRGCSVGCSFCAVSAPRLTDTWHYTENNAVLWQGILEECGQVLGEAAQHGLCYWATDPLDNPDYERFCLDYARILGRFPGTTTALALKNVDRTRELLTLSRQHGCLGNRFSLLTLGQVRRVMREFTPEELLGVELLFLNAESAGVKVAAGRALQRVPAKAGTIACVTGLHLNMVDRSLQLMTPCMADAESPLGYRVIARGTFNSQAEFADLLQTMVSDQCIPEHMSLQQPVGFLHALEFKILDHDRFRLSSPHSEPLTVSNDGFPPMVQLGQMLQAGRWTPTEIAAALTEAPAAKTHFLLEQFFTMGLLADDAETIELSTQMQSNDLARQLGHVKRLMEWYAADPAVREALHRADTAVQQRLGLEVDPRAVRALWDPDGGSGDSPLLQAYQDFLGEKLRDRDSLVTRGSPQHAELRAWRERHIERCRIELPEVCRAIPHAPLAIELCKGCSVGCWFCGVSAPKLTDQWMYTEENAALWQGILREFSPVLGAAAEQGLCYWATDPLDNPHYERFCLDYARILGYFPRTTTALALRDVRRTRSLLATSQEHGCTINRFSLLSLEQVRRVMHAFSAEELLFVDMVFQNPESGNVKLAAGRAPEKPGRRAETVVAGTIANVTGFHLNMVERMLQLVTPCLPDSRHPLGYRILVRGRFDSLADFASLLQHMTSARFMAAGLDEHISTVELTGGA